MPTIALDITDGAYDTYDTLTAAVPDYLDSQIDSTQVPGWVGLVEAEIRRRLALDPVRPQLTRDTIGLGAEYVTLPSDFLKEVSIDYIDDGVRKAIRFVDFTGLTDDAANPIPESWLFSTATDYTGPPEVAAVIDGELRLYPVPDATYPGTFLYYADLPAISETNQQNWFLAAHSDIYLYGLLYHANAFLPDEKKARLWFDLFDSRLDQVLTAYPKTPVRRQLRGDLYQLTGRHGAYDVWR